MRRLCSITLLVLVLAGCGGGRLSDAQYVHRLRVEGRSAFEAVLSVEGLASSGRAIAIKQLELARARVRKAVINLATIKPPADAVTDNATIVRALRSWGVALSRAQHDASHGELDDAEQAVRSIFRSTQTADASRVLGRRVFNSREVLGSELTASVPHWVKAEKLLPAALPGARLFATAGCTACHTYLGVGSSNLGAPDLTAIGTRNLGIDFQIRHLQCPSCVTPGSPMPKFASLGTTRLHQLAVFLEDSKGKR